MTDTTAIKRIASTDFRTLHAQIDSDPVIELNRRLQMWASVPDADGGALSPSAAIVPDVTVVAALALIESQQKEIRALRGALSNMTTEATQGPGYLAWNHPYVLNARALLDGGVK